MKHPSALKLTLKDYYPFGMLMPGRTYTAASGYRYGFNGKEMDNELKGEGNSLDFGARIMDVRLGKWLSVDPLFEKYRSNSPYVFVLNSPIMYLDPDGMIVKYAKGTDVKTTEYLGMKFKIFALRLFSPSYRRMYRDLKNDQDITYTIKAVTSVPNAQYGDYDFNTKTLSVDVRRDGDQLSISRQDFTTNSYFKIGHETGHAWRKQHHLDPDKPSFDPPLPPKFSIFDTPQERKRKQDEFAMEVSTYQKNYEEAYVKYDEETEVGGMEIENLIRSELNGKVFFGRVDLKVQYGSKLEVTKTYNPQTGTFNYGKTISYSNGGYSAFEHFARDYFNARHNIYQMYNVKPIKKR